MNPYEALPDEAFWRKAIAGKQPMQVTNIWKPKFRVGYHHRIATAGSCFAQHISKALIDRGYNWVDAEPAPEELSHDSKLLFNYGVFSFRTGNIYTAALLKQWVKWALEREPMPDEVWKSDIGRFIDPFRPSIEPSGFYSLEELQASRECTLRAIREALTTSKYFFFTLGLTEAWINRKGKYVYPMCPGTIAGEFLPELHQFKNFTYRDIRRDIMQSLEIIKLANPKIKFMLTVSPVPLTATADHKHVLVATTYSKSVLRAVAGEIADESADVDYFPSYELITGFPFRGMFFKENMRSITAEGVNFVMNSFFSCLESIQGKRKRKNIADASSVTVRNVAETLSDNEDDIVCEEELLSVFGQK